MLNFKGFAAETAGELHVLGHDGDAPGVDGAEVSVFKKANKVGLACLLESADSGSLEAQLRPVVHGNFADQALEGQLLDEQLCGLLELADLAKGNGAGAVAVGLFDSAGGWLGLAEGLCSELGARGLTAGG